MEYKLSKVLYPKIVVLKAAYSFTDNAYIFISQERDNYIINIESKHSSDISENDFKNRLLAEALRQEIFSQTKQLREFIVSRALASTILDEDNSEIEFSESFTDETILKDWFDYDDNN